MPIDTELTISYVSTPHLTHEEIQEKLHGGWGFKCACAICEDRRVTKKQVLKQRNTHVEELKAAFKRPTVDVAKLERTLAAIEKTYSKPASEVPHLALWDTYLLLVRVYSTHKRYDKTILTASKVLESLGFCISREDPSSFNSAFRIQQWGLMYDRAIEAFIHLWVAYEAIAPEFSNDMEKYARVVYKICIGEDETFDQIFGRIARQAMSGDKDLVKSMTT